MESGSLVERLRRLPGAEGLALRAGFDASDDLELDRVASFLLERFHRENDPEALALLYELAHPRLEEVARQVCRKLALAVDPEDLVAAFMTRLFTNVRRPQPRVRRFVGLAHTSMRNDALNQLRDQARALRRQAGFQATLSAPVDPAAAADDREEARVLLRLGACLAAVVDQCFHGLKLRDRRALLLREVDGLSYEEVAAQLGVPFNQVGAILRRARQRLTGAIGKALQPRRERGDDQHGERA